jgi:hypothetical protein
MKQLKIGDKVTRMLGGIVPMELIITRITDDEIICGMWKFSKQTGVEIDYDIDGIVSYIILE